jgi:N utilization substance protein B
MSEKASGTPAKSARHRARELALQGIYQWRMAGSDVAGIDKTTREEKSLGRYDVELFSMKPFPRKLRRIWIVH